MPEATHAPAPPQTPTLDDVDRLILRHLRLSARDSFVHIAEAVGTSEATVRARVKRLVDEGVIRRFTIRTAGANLKAMVEVAVDTNVHTEDLSAEIAALPGVDQVFEVSGDFDIIVIADVESTSALNDIIETIRNLPRVKSTRSRIILKEQ